MELKNYQKSVMQDLSAYMQAVNETPNLFQAWQKYWDDKDIAIGQGGVPAYNNSIASVPHVCMKVPTGGGKTYMACAALKMIFDAMPLLKEKVVVWLVPSNSILTQTISHLKNPDHPYRARLDRDFQGKVEVLTKEELLSGQNFSPDTVREELTVCVLSYDSLRIHSRKKDVRKVYQENGNLYRFAQEWNDADVWLPDTPETSLIQVLRQLSPVTIVDESHNASSDLSVEMLNHLHPSFVLDLTATPRENSNVISYVDARELKKEHMVKLPVIVYNRNTKDEVIGNAIRLRMLLESCAKEQEKQGAPYIRPIVLFQAQPKTSRDSQTFEKVKKLLMEVGIPEKEIAIKTSNVDDLKDRNLLSRDCPVRYIITVNALKEGWDCPFAYILASLANKTSKVDVEQILGRVLRQPYAHRQEAAMMNISYVLTCSADFRQTLDQIVQGLNGAGFSSKDYRIGDSLEESLPVPAVEPVSLFGGDSLAGDAVTAKEEEGTDVSDVHVDAIKASYKPYEGSSISIRESHGPAESQNGGTGTVSIDPLEILLKHAEGEEGRYIEEGRREEASGKLGGELGNMLHQYEIKEEFRASVESLVLPQFEVETGATLFNTEPKVLLTKEELLRGFSLDKQDASITFSDIPEDMYTVDLAEAGEAVPQYKLTQSFFGTQLRERLSQMADEEKLTAAQRMIAKRLSQVDSLDDSAVREYLKRVMAGLSEEEMERVMKAPETYAKAVDEKIKTLMKAYQKETFSRFTDNGTVTTAPMWHFPKVITPAKASASIPKGLYEKESNDMNNVEWKMALSLSRMDNVKWWHRNIEKKGFCLNGFLNHYPDFLVMTKQGRILAVETKGSYLTNDDSKDKLFLGRKWAAMAGRRYAYFMVFDGEKLDSDGSYTREEFLQMAKEL